VTAFAAAIVVIMAAGFGVGLLLRGGEAATEPFELYLTDAPGDLTRLDVRIREVSFGDKPLKLVNNHFDLLQHRGPGGALLVARGDVPLGAKAPVAIHFAAIRAVVDGVAHDIKDPGSLVIADLGAAPAALIDIDVPASLQVTASGFAFQPQALAVYQASLPEAAAKEWAPMQPAAAAQTSQPSVPPVSNAQVRLGDPEDVSRIEVRPADAGVAADPVAPTAEGQLGWFVEFPPGSTRMQMRATVDDVGAVFVLAYQSLPIAYVLADPVQVSALQTKESVVRVEAEESIQFLDAESRQAIRMPEVTHPVTGLRDRLGNPITGQGVGVAVVDSGIDALHPDLGYGPLNPAGAVAANYKVVSNQIVPTPNSDTTSGHGTHVAAIVGGRAAGDLRGVAPGAKLYGLGIGEASTTVWATQAFDWILQKHDQMDPPIRIVTNSWMAGTEYNPTSTLTQFVNALVDRGIVVVFAAGNNGGDGTSTQTSAQCQIPRAGVICVAAYDDLGTGTRNGNIAPYSSRGAISQPSTWPDISAPGTKVMSARPLAGTSTGVGVPNYVELSGTSQSTPHVAGVAALMLQMRSSLTPAAVESQIKATAYKFTDGGAYSGTSHFAKGAGLLDAFAAVQSVS
jgi:serine protease AprX